MNENNPQEDLSGFLLIDKPLGWTSFDVVAKTRSIIRKSTDRKVKVGHTGTLDPSATGLLILAIGSYTKKIDQILKQDKEYVAEVTLGYTSSTDDSEGELVKTSNTVMPSEEQIKSVLSSFVGEISQTPPIFSAIKVNGKRAYELARKQKNVELKPRKVKINAISNMSISDNKITFAVSVSSGTYIRSLARDIGEKLGTGAYLSSLRRTSIASVSVEDAIPIDELTVEQISNRLKISID